MITGPSKSVKRRIQNNKGLAQSQTRNKEQHKPSPFFLILRLLLIWILFLPAVHGQETGILSYRGKVAVRGSAYTGLGQFKFALIRPAFVASGTANATAVINGGFVTSINLASGGSGYAEPPSVTISGGGGSGASATALVNGGVVNSISINNPGSGYVSIPDVIISSPYNSWITEWSNDGTSLAGGEPNTSISLNVADGIFSVRIGDTSLQNMASIPQSALANQNLQLRVWFNDGHTGWQSLGESPLSMAPQAAHANPFRKQYTNQPFQIFIAGNSGGTGASGNFWPGDSYGRFLTLPFTLSGTQDSVNFQMWYPLPDRAVTINSLRLPIEGLGTQSKCTISLIRIDRDAAKAVVASVSHTFGHAISSVVSELSLNQDLDWDNYQYFFQIDLQANRYLNSAGTVWNSNGFVNVKSCNITYSGTTR